MRGPLASNAQLSRTAHDQAAGSKSSAPARSQMICRPTPRPRCDWLVTRSHRAQHGRPPTRSSSPPTDLLRPRKRSSAASANPGGRSCWSCSQRVDDLAPQNAPHRRLAHRFIVRKIPLTWVELSGLEPLTSCMPCRPISSATVAASLVPARQATCGVWVGPALAARVWVRSHLVCHWLSGPHQGGETHDKQRPHRRPHSPAHQQPGDHDNPTRTGTATGIWPGLAYDPPEDDHGMAAGDRPWLTGSSGSPPPWP